MRSKGELKNNKIIKSIKVSNEIHRDLSVLGFFMNEKKMYRIIQNLINSYLKNEMSVKRIEQFKYISKRIENNSEQ